MFKVIFNSPLNLFLLKMLFFQIITLLHRHFTFLFIILILHILPLPFGMSA